MTLRDAIRRYPRIVQARHEVRFRLMKMGLVGKFGDFHSGQRVDDPALDLLFAGTFPWLDEVLRPFRGEFNAWPLSQVHNGWFDSGDAETYYGMLRTHRPDQVVEVGSGWSTRFALRALTKNGKGRVTCIDPAPRIGVRGVEHRRQRVEEAPREIFRNLGRGDVLFIDSSHSREEALSHLPILSDLRLGVFVHHHDICYPFQSATGEEPVILDYYKQHGQDFRLLGGLAYAHATDTARLTRLVPARGWNPRTPGSMWVVRR